MVTTGRKISLGPALEEWYREAKEHLRYEYDLTPDALVIDCGAYKGEFAEQIYDRYLCTVICIEPTQHISQVDGNDKMKIINAAAWTEDGFLEMGGDYFFTSIYEDDKVRYKCVDLARIIKEAGEIDLLKLNVEGSEYALMKHLIKTGAVDMVKNIQVQFHVIDDVDIHKEYAESIKGLHETHELTWHYPFVWENWKLKN